MAESKVTEQILTEKQKQNRANAKAKAEARKAVREQAAAEGKPIPSKKAERVEAKNNAELAKAEQKMVAEPPVDEGINIKQNELAEEQNALSEMNEGANNAPNTPTIDYADTAAQLGLDNDTLSNALSGDVNARDAIDTNMNEASKSIFEVDEKGYAKPVDKMTFAEGWEKIAPIATVLSGIIFALSGGAFPPINFNKLSGLDDRYKSYLNLCEEQNKLTMGASAKNTAEGIRAGQDVETANAAANIENAQDKDLLAFKDKLDTNSKITLSKLANEQQKEIMQLAAAQDAEALSRKFSELLNQGFSREELTTLATAFGAQMGITPNQQAAITFGKFAQPINDTVNTGLNAAKTVATGGIGCDKRIKDFFKFKRGK